MKSTIHRILFFGFMLTLTTHSALRSEHEVVEQTSVTTQQVGSKHIVVAPARVRRKSSSARHETPAAVDHESANISSTPVQTPFLCSADGSLCQVFFSPTDGLREKLIQLIDAEQEAISIAVFTFTEKEIAHALLRAYDRGVQLSIIVDPVCVRDRYNKIGMLCDHNVCTFVYNAQHAHSGMQSSMHHKFALFKKNMGNKPLLWTGSFNFTRSAAMSNHENALVLNNPEIIAQFERQFEHIKSQSYRYKISKKNHADA